MLPAFTVYRGQRRTLFPARDWLPVSVHSPPAWSPVPTTPMWARLTTVASQPASRSMGYREWLLAASQTFPPPYFPGESRPTTGARRYTLYWLRYDTDSIITFSNFQSLLYVWLTSGTIKPIPTMNHGFIKKNDRKSENGNCHSTSYSNHQSIQSDSVTIVAYMPDPHKQIRY